ncbi:hypothetical protein J7T55_009389 [Diaporthe amygdali]|uniref:uncharacterized protein n=1 Tax=Phomopsis amygdali TaxID=1214568 RepID=UPI0022FF1E82|nr:uncharacterized protein J7T55_009389 [Diaporthe amygdali]KAJ0107424.1 hypothetical protein J7T55_009389 [Diaporthe amygdali]
MSMTATLSSQSSEAPTRDSAVKPPPGVTSNFDDPPDAGHNIAFSIAITSTVLILSLFLVRGYVKVFILRQITIEDANGAGYHAWDVTTQQYGVILKWLYITSVLYCPAAYFIKATLLLLTARVFAIYERLAKAIKWFVTALALTYIPIQFIKMFICVPVESFWNHNIQPTRCLSQAKAFIFDLSLAILTDSIILIIPIVLIWHLAMPLTQRLKIAAILGAGGIALGITTYRMYLLSSYLVTDDVTSAFVYLDITVISELTIGFICASVPSCNVLLGHIKALYRQRQVRPSVSVQQERHWQSDKHWWDNWLTTERWTAHHWSKGVRSGNTISIGRDGVRGQRATDYSAGANSGVMITEYAADRASRGVAAITDPASTFGDE